MPKIPTPTKKSKAARKAIVEQRRKERDKVRKTVVSHHQKDVEAAHSAASIEAALNSPEAVKARTESQFATILISKLKERLRAGIGVEPRLNAKNPGFDLQVVSTRTGDEDSIGVNAYTDFRTISINLESRILPSPSSRPEEISDFIGTVRGIFHHEAGHILHTYPLTSLAMDFDKDVLKGKHAPLAARLAKFVPPPVDASKQDVESRWRKVHQTWNLIEDQRMESARVRDFPACQRYFEHLVYDLLTRGRTDEWWDRSWLLLAGREYLPMDVWQTSYNLCKTPALDWLRIVRRYKAAATTPDMVEAMVEALEYLEEHQEDLEDLPCDDHAMGEPGYGDPSGTTAGPGQGASKPGDGSEGDGAGDGDGEGGKGDNTPTEDPDFLNAGRGTGDGYFTKKDFGDVVKKMQGGTSKADTAVVAESMVEAAAPGLREYDGDTQPMSGAQIGEAQSLATGIERALETYVTEATPTWQWRTEEGIIDPCAYRTRDAGALDYHMGMDGESGKMLDLHVSVCADVSYSMSSHMPQLSVMLLGMKMAVDTLGIPNNFNIWSDDPQNHAIYENGPREVIFPALGGTNPQAALNDAVIRNEERRPNHLFIILTDGEWYGMDSINPWRTSVEQQFVIVKWGQGPREIHGADALIDLPKLSAFPDLLEDALDRMLSKVV